LHIAGDCKLLLETFQGAVELSDHDPSTSQNIKYPHWQREFEAALIEADLQKLRQRVDAAEAALFLRSQSLVEDPQGQAERQAISDAIRTLRTIQREKLGYPDWNKKQ
jgi:hypothetical protein